MGKEASFRPILMDASETNGPLSEEDDPLKTQGGQRKKDDPLGTPNQCIARQMKPLDHPSKKGRIKE